jgi:hypothetical protein
MSVLSDLLQSLPEYWNIDPESVPVIRVTYKADPITNISQPCWVHIVDDKLELIPQDDEHNRQTICLDLMVTDALTQIPYQMRLSDLVFQINNLATGHPFHAEIINDHFDRFTDGSVHLPDFDNVWRQNPLIYTNVPLPARTPPLTEAENDGGAPKQYTSRGWYLNLPGTHRPIMIPGFGNGIADLGAVVLTDGEFDLGVNANLEGASSLVWALLRPIARTLRCGYGYGAELVRQIDLRNVDGPWLDRWGEIYGVPRVYPETDNDYRRRLSSTVFQPRMSPTSIEKALTEGLGLLNVEIEDDVAPYKFKITVTVREEDALLFSNVISDIINRYRAAGTLFTLYSVVHPEAEQIVAPTHAWRMTQGFTSGQEIVYYYADTRVPVVGWGVLTNESLTFGPMDHLMGGFMFGGEGGILHATVALPIPSHASLA